MLMMRAGNSSAMSGAAIGAADKRLRNWTAKCTVITAATKVVVATRNQKREAWSCRSRTSAPPKVNKLIAKEASRPIVMVLPSIDPSDEIDRIADRNRET